MHTSALITAAAGGLFVHAMLRLWRNREAPGAAPCLLLFAAASVYAPAVLLAAPPPLLVQLACLAAAAMPGLLLIAVCDYAGIEPAGWRRLRWVLVGGVTAVAALALVMDAADSAAAVAATEDLILRSAVIRQALQGPWLPVTVTSYGLAALILGVAVTDLLRSPGRRRDMAILCVLTLTVTGVDVAYLLTGFTLAGMTPTPLVIVTGMLAATLLLYHSNMFDLRPIARSVLIDSVKDGMLVVDDRHRVIDCNGAAASLLERPRKELIGRPAAALLPREFAAMLQSTVHLRTELAVHLHGARAWFEVDVTPLDLRGRRAGHLITARDISERRLAQEALVESRRALETANARLVEQSVTDPLTGLKNRRFLFQRLNEEISRHQRSGSVLGLLVVDIDHFKSVNDTHGHPVGDEALMQVADTLTASVRDCDVVARLGGEEFAVIAVNADAGGLMTLAERIREALSSTPVARDTARPMVLTASIGVAVAGPDAGSADALFAEADRYLYEAKHRGRNQVVASPMPRHVKRTG